MPPSSPIPAATPAAMTPVLLSFFSVGGAG